MFSLDKPPAGAKRDINGGIHSFGLMGKARWLQAVTNVSRAAVYL